MKKMEQFSMSPSEKDAQVKKEKKSENILYYLEKHIVGKNESVGEDEEKEIKTYYKKLSSREKADILYSKLMAYIVDKEAQAAQNRELLAKGQAAEIESPDPYLISEIKVLLSDKETKTVFSQTYGQARVESKEFRVSELGKLWKTINDEISRKEADYKKIEQDLHLNRIRTRGKISAASSRMERLADNLAALDKTKTELETLAGLPKTPENTDAVANFQLEKFKEYKTQLDKEGFVWLPSRHRIHRETISAILNHRWPVLTGEAGSGKSEQADAAALELTGYLPTKIQCENNTGETQLIKETAIDPETGGSFDKYGALMKAFTGYDDSRQSEPSVKTGRIARFEESGRMGPKAYSIIKEARQLKAGDKFYGREVLPGASAIWTTNPVGSRYPDRYLPDPAMRRELAEITVDYPDKLELYEFSLVALLDKNNHIQAAKEELSPAYEKKDIPEAERETLKDGSVIIAKHEMIENGADVKHGVLWRFAGAVKAVQDSFVYGNVETAKYPDTLLRFKGDDDDNLEVTTDGSGEPLTLSTSTITLGEVASWMTGFNERKQKQDSAFHVNSLSEWLDLKIKTYLKQADKADKGKLKAIFKHFHFLEDSYPDLSAAKPLTPKEIGYLSPRVPRPVDLERPKKAETEEAERPPEEDLVKEKKVYETRQVLLEDGSKILIKVREITLGDVLISEETKFRLNKEDFSFAGIIEDPTSEYNGSPVGQLAGENLYRIFSHEDLDRGVFCYESEELMRSIDEELPAQMQSYWEAECVNNPENNPDNVEPPQF